MKPLVAGLLTAAVLAAMLFAGSRATVRAPSTDPEADDTGATPAEEAVRRLIRLGDAGDVDGYLASFSGPLRERLGREVEGRGREAFADDLRRAAGARKGHAVFAAEPDGDLAARVAVETIYPDRNERQAYRVEKSDEGWRVVEVATARTLQPPVRFGASASPEISGEGPPHAPPPPKVGLTVDTGDEPESP